MVRRLLLSSFVPVAILITVVSGLFLLASNLAFYYGYPLGWRLDYCPIAAPFGCSSFYWTAFVLDVLFYSALGYGLLLILTRVKRSLTNPRLKKEATPTKLSEMFLTTQEFLTIYE